MSGIRWFLWDHSNLRYSNLRWYIYTCTQKTNTQRHIVFVSNHNHKRSFINWSFLWKAQHLLYSITIWVVFIRDIDPALLVRLSNTEFYYKGYLKSQLLGSLLQIISLLNNQRNIYWAKRQGMFSRGIQIPRSQTRHWKGCTINFINNISLNQ